MKKFILILSIILYSCSSHKTIHEYKVGDMLYIKPDSTKIVVYENYNFTDKYFRGIYKNNHGEFKTMDVNKEQIYK